MSTTLTADTALWVELRQMIQTDPDAWHALRRQAEQLLLDEGAEEIGSSDVNHAAVSILRERHAVRVWSA